MSHGDRYGRIDQDWPEAIRNLFIYIFPLYFKYFLVLLHGVSKSLAIIYYMLIVTKKYCSYQQHF